MEQVSLCKTEKDKITVTYAIWNHWDISQLSGYFSLPLRPIFSMICDMGNRYQN